MDISKLTRNLITSYGPSATPTPNVANRAADAPPATDSDSVQLSTSLRGLAVARQQVAAAPDTRDARIAALRQQVQSGTYQIDAEALARRLIGLGSER